MTKKSVYAQRHKTIQDRFNEKIDKTEGCWYWRSAVGSRGYGIFWHSSERKSVFAHRFSYELHHGKTPESGKVVMHSCDNPLCVNPAHLSVGTTKDNALDAKQKNRLAVGERNGGGKKLSEKQVYIIKMMKGAIGSTKMASIFNVSSNTIKRIRNGKIWSSVEYPKTI